MIPVGPGSTRPSAGRPPPPAASEGAIPLSATTQHFDFDSREIGDDEAAFGAYRDLYAVGADVTRTGRPFRARVRAVRLDSILLFERMLDGVSHSRAARAGQDGMRHFAFHLVLAGELHGGPECGYAVARPGDLVVADTARPTRTEAVALHAITASVPERRLAPPGLPESVRPHGRLAGGEQTALVREVVAAALRHGPDADAAIVRATAEALVTVLAAFVGAPAAPRLGVEAQQREAALRLIASRLHDRSLDAAEVARAMALSPRSLARLFQPLGGVARVTMEMRLAAVREAIEKGVPDSVAALAAEYGFADESHLSRRFSQANGVTISALRKELAEEPPTARRLRRLAQWLEILGG